jgi:hypothetical protein
MTIREAQDYLLPQQHVFWEWNCDELLIQSIDGKTIAFADELALILDRFRVQGLPRLDCILLLVAATRDSWIPADSSTNHHQWVLECCQAAKLESTEAMHLIELLDQVRSLPPELRHDLNTRATICEMCLEDLVPRCRGQAIPLVLSGLRKQLENVPSREIERIPSEDLEAWQLDFRSLSKGLERLDQAKLLLRIKTGLDQVPKPASELADDLSEVPFSDAVEARELIETLLQDAELYPIGRLAKDLLAAMYRPARLTPETNTNLGGYSDISNRGTLDRLLLTELAHDNDTLAVRVSNSEALYLRREVPPSKESLDRCLLIESTIRSWGTPRVYQAAVAIALTASAPTDSCVFAWRCSGTSRERRPP